MTWSACWLLWFFHSGSFTHFRRLHLGPHHASIGSSRSITWPSKDIVHSLLKLNSLKVLLVFDFFFHVLVPLKKLIVLCFSQLQSFIQIGLQFLLKGIHFILLLLYELSFGCYYFLVSIFHVFLSFFDFHFLSLILNLMCIGIAVNCKNKVNWWNIYTYFFCLAKLA